ncbi:MAG: restriction endonuclease subunit S [Verrucomicrobiota bacterium]
MKTTAVKSNLPTKWVIKTIGELCDVARGGSPRPIKSFITADPDGINWIKISDATASGKYIYKTEQKIKPEGVSRSRFVKPNDFLLSNSMSFGKPYILKTSGCIHDGWLVLSDKKGEFKQDYLYHYLSSSQAYSQFDNLAAGSTVRNLNTDAVRKVKVPIPPLAEQERIVSILDEAFAAIETATANAEKNLQNARELFQSVLQDTFSKKGDDWVEVTLGEIGPVSMCKRVLKKQTTPTGEIPFFKIGTFGKEPDAYISRNLYEDYLKKYAFPKPGDILISASGTIGRRVIYDGEPAYFQDSNIVWLDNPEKIISNKLLFHFYGICKWNASKGATIARLYNDDLRRIRLCVPPFHTQQAIVKKLDSLSEETRRLVSIYQRKKAALAELKQSLLQKAFTGQL